MQVSPSSVTRYITSLAFVGLIVVTGIALVKSGNSVLNFVSKGGDAEFQAVAITDDAMDKLAKAMGCAVEAMSFEPYPG